MLIPRSKDFQMIVLWTDALIYILIVIMTALAMYLRGKEHFKRPLQVIAGNRVGMVSLAVLCFFIIIGLLDSVHFKPTNGTDHDIISLLDYWATPLRQHGEKTYSAPFAVTLYNKEMTTLPDGSTRWDYPRLHFGGSHLANPGTEKWGDILQKSFYGFFQGSSLFAFFMVLLWGTLKSRSMRLLRGTTAKTVWAVVFILVSISYTLCYLSGYYHVLGTDKVGEEIGRAHV